MWRRMTREHLRLWSIPLLLAFLAFPVSAQSNDPFQPFEFALLGDPQIGYGQGGEYADANRFGQVVDHINAQQLPLTVVAGDLVQDRSIWQDWIFDWVVSRLQGDVLLAAGNHDVVDVSSLRAFRSRHGKDYYNKVTNNVAFVVINSETARDASVSVSEFEAQWDFIRRSLTAHRQAKRAHIVLVMHRPPFVEDEAEPESGQNWPLNTRTQLLSLAREHGVRWILAGHLHRTVTIEARDGLQFVVGAGSARSFDRSPIGYHRFRVGRDALSFEKVEVAPPPREPFSVRGLRGWTPRLFDPSLRHWLFTLFYVAAGGVALASSRRLAQRNNAEAVAGSSLWLAVATALFAFGANMQLDLDELIGELFRLAAKLAGVFSMRHWITGTATLVVTVVAVFLLARLHARAGRDKAGAIALTLLAVPTAWFFLSVISHHDIGMLFNEGWWDLLIVGALVGITACARRVLQRNSP